MTDPKEKEDNVMKSGMLFILMLLIVPFCYATLDSAGTLLIPRADTAPVIDGNRDMIWRAASEIFLNQIISGESNRENWFDCSASFRTLWYEEDLYFYIQVKDDDPESHAFDLNEEGPMDNSIAIFLSTQSGFETHDVRLAFGNAAGRQSTEYGYVIETKIPAGMAGLTLETGTEFLLNFLVNDCSAEGETGFTRMSWAAAGGMKNARLTDYTASEIFNVEQAHFTPEIDGILEEAWLGVHEMNPSHYIQEGVTETFEQQIDWTDNWFTARTLWDEDYLYIFMEAYDDVVSATHANSWQNDTCELYFDGDNSKHVSSGQKVYDSNDFQYRREVDGSQSGDNIRPDAYGFMETGNGWNMEFAFDLQKLDIPPVDGHLFGYDVQKSDNDDVDRSSIVRWWATGHEGWKDPSLFGTAKLVAASSMNIESVSLPESFGLEQNYPNPFNPATVIAFSLDRACEVKLDVYDVMGRHQKTLVHSVKSAGRHNVQFDGSHMPSGIYFYRLFAGGRTIVRKMILMQ